MTVLVQDKKLQQLFKTHVAQINSQLASHETIKKFLVLENEFSIETGELTPSLKVKRKFSDQKFAKEISSLYE